MPRVSKSFTLGEVKALLLEANKDYDSVSIFQDYLLAVGDGNGWENDVDDNTFIITLSKDTE